MHHSRDGFASLTDGIRIYVFGGCLMPSAEVFDTKLKSWSLLPPMREPRSCGSCSQVGNDIFVVGGLDTWNRAIFSIEVFNVISHSWSFLETKVKTKRVGCATLAVGHCLYIFGGHYNVEVYDTLSKQWSSFPDCTDEIYSLPSVSLIGSQIYVVGGITQDSIVESVRIYDLHAKVWACQTSVKFVGSCTHATSSDEMKSMRLFGTAEDRPTNTIVEYNPLRMRLASTSMPPMTIKRVGCALVEVNEFLYAIGGHDGITALKSIEIYNLNSLKQSKPNSQHSQEQEHNHTCVVCLESPSSFAFVPCGHQSLCQQCATLYSRRRILSCAICRGESSFIMQVYN